MISVTLPIDRAISRTRNMLFTPFDLEKWFVLGFCAFLAGLVEAGGGGFNVRSPMPQHYKMPQLGGFEQASAWLMGHLPLVVGLGLGLLVLVIALTTLFQWLGSRGQLMFLDGVIHDRAAVVEPWQRFRDLGNDLFVFRFLLGLCSLGVFALLGFLGWSIARPDIAAHQFGSAALLALVVAGGPALLVVLALLLVSLLLGDFIVPLMYHLNIRTGQAFGVLWKEIIPGHGGSFVLFYLMKLVLTVAAGLIVVLGTCCTCCLLALPYLGSVAFLPLWVFFRSYSLYFLEQFGEDWRLLDGPAVQPADGDRREA